MLRKLPTHNEAFRIIDIYPMKENSDMDLFLDNMEGVHRRLSGGGLPYEDILMLAVFFACVWYGGRLATAFKFPNIPVEIGIGMLFGPYGLDLVHEFSHDYSPLQAAGFIGVGIVIFESGMHLSIDKVANWDM